MRLKPCWVIVLLLAVFILAGCNRTVLPALSPLPAQPTHEVITFLQLTALPIVIRLPLVANGSSFTPTPFLPIASTLVSPLPSGNQVFQTPEPWSKVSGLSEPAVTPIPPPMPLLGDQASVGADMVNILLIGADQRAGSKFRTDTLIIASIRPLQHSVTLISIPRDLFVYIPGWTMQRINTAYLHGEVVRYPGGGAALLKETILYNLGVRIDHLAVVNFNGFRKIINIVGGVDLPLYCPYTDWRAIDPKGDLENPANWYLYTVGPGVVHMDGELALWYARSRLHSNDYDRGRRQQEVLRGLFAQATRVNIIPRLPEVYQQVSDVIVTDMSFEDLMALAPMALTLDAPRIRSFYINNRLVKAWRTPDGASVLLPKRDNIAQLIQEAMSPLDAGEAARLGLVVEILNNTPREGLEFLAAERLHYAGFETRFGQAGDIDRSKTWLYDLTGGTSVDHAQAILELFGIPAGRLIPVNSVPDGPQFQLVVGEDFDPCFNPSKINR